MKKVLTGMAVAVVFLSACNSKGTFTVGTDSTSANTERNRQTALAVEKYLSEKNIDAMIQACKSDFIDYGSGEEKPMSNLDTIKASLKAYVAAFPDLKGENLSAFAHGDSVVVLGTWSGTFKKDFMGMKATNHSFKYPDADIFTFDKAGKITSHRSTQSAVSYFSQLGITPMPVK